MPRPDLGPRPGLKPEAVGYSPAFTGLLDTVVNLVEENPPSPNDTGHPDHGTRVFLPTRREDHSSSAFVGWEQEAKPVLVKLSDGRSGVLHEIAHANVESVWFKSTAGVSNYRHTLTREGVVIRHAFTEIRQTSGRPAQRRETTVLSDDQISGLNRRLAA